jgi:hypothetical protein
VEFAPGGCEGVFVGWVDVTGDGGEVMTVQSVVSYCLEGRGAYGYVLTLSLRRNRATLGLEESSSGNVKMRDETTFLFCFWSVILMACGVVEINPANPLGDLGR